MIRLILGLSLTLIFGLSGLVQPASAQDDTYDLPIQVINCPDEPSGVDFFEYVDQGLCEPGSGLSFTVTDIDGEVYGSCESVVVGLYAQCTVSVPVGSTVIVYEDIVPEGYAVWDAPGWIEILEAAIQAGEGPYAGMVNVLQQNDTYSLPISAINCPTMPGPDEFPFENWDHPCEPATGIRFVAQVGTEEVGSCVTEVFNAREPQAAAHCPIQVPYGTTVTVVEDVTTVPEGYIAVDPPVVVVETPPGPGGDQPIAQFINVQGTPIGGESPPQLPSTGAGPSLKQLVSFFK
jgi:hypothetical protein